MATTKTGRTIEQAATEWEFRIIRKITNELDKPVTVAKLLVHAKLIDLAGEAETRTAINVPVESYIHPSGRVSKSRTEVDLHAEEEIWDRLGQYKKKTSQAISSIYQSADAQPWRVDVFDKAMAAVEKDSDIQTKEMKEIVNAHTLNLKKAVTYNDAIACAAMLIRDMREMTKHLLPHLEDIARREYSKQELRTTRGS
jgi:hypothetical protein